MKKYQKYQNSKGETILALGHDPALIWIDKKIEPKSTTWIWQGEVFAESANLTKIGRGNIQIWGGELK